MQNAEWGSNENAGRGQPGYIMQRDFNRGDPLPGFGIKVSQFVGTVLFTRRPQSRFSLAPWHLIALSAVNNVSVQTYSVPLTQVFVYGGMIFPFNYHPSPSSSCFTPI